MQISTHRLGSSHRDITGRVRDIADQAAYLVTQNVGPIGHVDLVVTDDLGAKLVIRTAQQELLGTRAKAGKGGRHRAGATTVSPSGILVVINADASLHRQRVEIDKTVIHELVHAAQLSPAAARQDAIAGLRNNYGLVPMTRAAARTANDIVAAHERQAADLERLATQLR